MTLPPLPEPEHISDYGEVYTEAQLLALQAATVEACAARLMEMHGIVNDRHKYFHHAALELRKLK
jgi:hypothetical protein